MNIFSLFLTLIRSKHLSSITSSSERSHRDRRREYWRLSPPLFSPSLFHLPRSLILLSFCGITLKTCLSVKGRTQRDRGTELVITTSDLHEVRHPTLRTKRVIRGFPYKPINPHLVNHELTNGFKLD